VVVVVGVTVQPLSSIQEAVGSIPSSSTTRQLRTSGDYPRSFFFGLGPGNGFISHLCPKWDFVCFGSMRPVCPAPGCAAGFQGWCIARSCEDHCGRLWMLRALLIRLLSLYWCNTCDGCRGNCQDIHGSLITVGGCTTMIILFFIGVDFLGMLTVLESIVVWGNCRGYSILICRFDK